MRFGAVATEDGSDSVRFLTKRVEWVQPVTADGRVRNVRHRPFRHRGWGNDASPAMSPGAAHVFASVDQRTEVGRGRQMLVASCTSPTSSSMMSSRNNTPVVFPRRATMRRTGAHVAEVFDK
jgi:hypothetical protein